MDLSKLAEHFPHSAISWRAQAVSNGKALALAYIDARDVMERLDSVCGLGGWQCRYPHANGKTICEIGIKVGDEWIWKADGAGDTDIEAEKGAISDAFKRSAVKWGIGRYLYSVEAPWVPCEVGQNGKFKKFTADPWQFVKEQKSDGWAEAGKFAADYITAINECTTHRELGALRANKANAPKLRRLEEKYPDLYSSIQAAESKHSAGFPEIPSFIGRAANG